MRPMKTTRIALAHAAPSTRESGRAISVIALAAEAHAAPEWVQMFPAAEGALEATDGRTFSVRDIEAVIAASLAGGRELAIDFDHAIDLAAKDGRRAPAAGWIQEMEVRQGALWARVAWNDLGQRALAGREYRFLSPVFTHTSSGEVTRVLRASLTNNPAFEMAALAQSQETSDVDFLKKLAKALGLDPEKTTEEAALAAAQELVTASEQTVELKALASALGLEPDKVTPEQAVTAVAALKSKGGTATGTEQPDPSKFVDMATFQATRDELAKLQQTIGQEKAVAAVDAAIKDGRLIPAQRDWAIAYASKDLEGFQGFVGQQPQIVGGRVAPTGGEGEASLTEDERAICQALGVTEEQFVASRKREQEAVQ